ncbi:OmpA/MotB family protein [Fervidicella metallireducens]|uniref:OmpA/MotB family protein n=1 Tax=Fervidicella metallireducens TaxID=655338 RepID=UPI000ADBF677|nr:OmpA family protein [Fervidicella metallireducens]
MENAGLKGETEKNYKQVADFIKKHKLEDKVSIKEDSRGVIIEMQEKILFDSGKSELKKSSLEVINKICELLKQFPNEIIVEGHTDNIPINKGYFRSNWELSADRAVKVVRYMSEVNGLNPKQFKAVGCGEFSPIADNNSPEGRQKNRRVNILIVSTEKENKDNGSKKE